MSCLIAFTGMVDLGNRVTALNDLQFGVQLSGRRCSTRGFGAQNGGRTCCLADVMHGIGTTQQLDMWYWLGGGEMFGEAS